MLRKRLGGQVGRPWRKTLKIEVDCADQVEPCGSCPPCESVRWPGYEQVISLLWLGSASGLKVGAGKRVKGHKGKGWGKVFSEGGGEVGDTWKDQTMIACFQVYDQMQAPYCWGDPVVALGAFQFRFFFPARTICMCIVMCSLAFCTWQWLTKRKWQDCCQERIQHSWSEWDFWHASAKSSNQFELAIC